MKKNVYSLIGYAYGSAANTPGCDSGPSMLRSLRLADQLHSLGYQVLDLGDATQEATAAEIAQVEALRTERESKINNLAPTYLACKRLYDKTLLALQQNSMPLILGGDHSLSIGSVAAVSDFYHSRGENIGLLWIDTHADINTPETSPSNNIFGMSVACLLGLIPGVLASLQKNCPSVETNNIAYVGLRSVDPGEKLALKAANILCFTMKEIDILGMAEVMKRALKHVTQNTSGFIASFDLDVCDPALVPGTGTPVRGGLTFREAHLLMELIHDSNKMLALEMVELNPKLDTDGITANLAISLIESALGKSIL